MPSKKNRIQIYVTDDEFKEIQSSSERAGLSMSTFAKRVCLGTEVKSVEGAVFRLELRRLHADIGRVGGLLKLWLTERDQHAGQARRLLHELEDRQSELQKLIDKI